MKSRFWIIVFSVAAVLCLGVWLFISNVSSQSLVVGIYQDGSLVEKIDLNSVTGEREITLSGEYGDNVILVSNGHISMKSADCPDKICVEHGELKSSASPIVCLPNKVVIKFENSTDGADAKTGAIKCIPRN
ncbi:MAG: NusG domain II-containing protein [Ruminococcus sp.]